MQVNWSLILNVLLLTGVVVALVRMLKLKRVVEEAPAARATPQIHHPSISAAAEKSPDEVIAVRKITREPVLTPAQFAPTSASTVRPHLNTHPSSDSMTKLQATYGVVAPPPGLMKKNSNQPETVDANASVQLNLVEEPVLALQVEDDVQITKEPSAEKEHIQQTLMIFLLAKENRQLAGYELLQTILSAGLRFGDGHLFHRHQYANGQGPVLCSLATATASGVFDLQNIGAFSVHGLCLFMQTSGNHTVDLERLSVMIDTAKQLSEGLDTYMLDAKRQPWCDESEKRYEGLLS